MKRLVTAMLIGTTALSAQITHPNLPREPQPRIAQGEPKYKQPYKAKDYSYLLGMPGFTDKALNDHFTLYRGYVKNVNELIADLNRLEAQGKQKSHCWADMKRRFGWEFDGMRLHEYYFDSLGGDGKIDETSALYKAIVAQWGTHKEWERDFIDTGLMRGIGWAMIVQDPESGRLINLWIQEHDHGHIAQETVILPMDVWEHAYLIDYGLDRAAYIQAFLNNLDWEVIEERYAKANKK